jgi:hypothetical protein
MLHTTSIAEPKNTVSKNEKAVVTNNKSKTPGVQEREEDGTGVIGLDPWLEPFAGGLKHR